MRIVRWCLFGLFLGSSGGASASDLAAWLDSVVTVSAGPGLCAGVLIDDQGTVATAYHCVASGRRPTLGTRDGTETRGQVVRTAPREDLALIAAPELAGRPHLLVRAAPAVQGEEVWALGHPYGMAADQSPALAGVLRWSVSRGVVSAVGERLIQVDAAVNPGNSGGPVVDTAGRIIGITSRKLRADNVGFLAPAAAVDALVASEKRPFPIGGSYGVHAVALMPVDFGTAPSLGVGAHVAVRDTLVITGHAAYALGANWMAAEQGSARWTGVELLAAGRLRLARGRFSTSLDVGGGLALDFGRSGAVVDGQLVTRTEAITLSPEIYGRVELFGVGVRVAELRRGPGDWALIVALETGLGGPLGTF